MGRVVIGKHGVGKKKEPYFTRGWYKAGVGYILYPVLNRGWQGGDVFLKSFL